MADRRTLKLALFAVFVVALLSLPFVLLGEEYALPLLECQESRAWTLGLIAIALLTADSVAPVPSSLVMVGVALKAGWVVGTVTGTIGLCGQVLASAWFGRVALGRMALRLLGEGDANTLRDSVQRRLTVTLGCLRSVPLLAESSVVIAASLGIPLRRIFGATVLPNIAIAASYSVAAEAGILAAIAAVLGSIVASLIAWRIMARPPKR